MSSGEDQDREPGTEQWSFETGYGLYCSPTIVDGTVYVGSTENLYAVETGTGTEQWASETGSGDSIETGVGIFGSPVMVDGTVYVGSTDNNLCAMDAATGTEQWDFETEGRVRSSPAVVDRTVYVGSQDGNLYAVDAATGTEQWAFETGDGLQSPQPLFQSSPTVVDGTVYVGSTDNNLYAVDAATGTEQWAFETGDGVQSSPAVVDGTVYVGSRDGNLYAIDAATGTERWTFQTQKLIQSSPAVVDGTVYIGSSDNNLYAVDAATGTEQWAFEAGGQVNSSPAVVDGTVYVGSQDGNLYAVEAATGTERWVFKTSYGVEVSSPAVVDGTVYAGSDDLRLYAITASSKSETHRSQPSKKSPEMNHSSTEAESCLSQGDLDKRIQSIRSEFSKIDSLVTDAEFEQARQILDNVENQISELKEKTTQQGPDMPNKELRQLEKKSHDRLSKHRVLTQLREMDPYKFEELVAKIWKKDGWNTKVKSGSGDKGVDIEATIEDTFEKRRHLIQVKRHSENTVVGSEHIQLYSSLYQRDEQVDNVFVVTSNRFTSEAEEVAKRRDVSTIDAEELYKKLIET